MIEQIRLASITPFSSRDFPGRLAAVIFLQGCNWRCSYCHNSAMQARDRQPDSPSWEDALAWLSDRRGLIGGVVFSGGEPTLQADLATAIGEVHSMGFEVGLHTSGAYPDWLEACLPHLAWVGLDFKMPAARLAELTGVPAGHRVGESIRRVLASGIAYEIRTTVDAAYHDQATLEAMAAELAECGVPRSAWVLQVMHDDDGRICPLSAAIAHQAAQTLGLRLQDINSPE